MNKFLSLFVIAVALFGISAPTSAQVYGTYQYCNGIWRFGNCGGPTYMPPPPGYSGYNGYGQQGMQVLAPASGLAGGLNKCESLGAIAGGTLGSLARHHNVQAIILGAIGGLIAGNAVCTNNQGQQVLVVQQPGVVAQGFSNVPQQVGASCPAGTQPGVLNLPGNPRDGQTVCAVPGDTNISKWF